MDKRKIKSKKARPHASKATWAWQRQIQAVTQVGLCWQEGDGNLNIMGGKEVVKKYLNVLAFVGVVWQV